MGGRADSTVGRHRATPVGGFTLSDGEDQGERSVGLVTLNIGGCMADCIAGWYIWVMCFVWIAQNLWYMSEISSLRRRLNAAQKAQAEAEEEAGRGGAGGVDG